jgi:hypothetical protein
VFAVKRLISVPVELGGNVLTSTPVSPHRTASRQRKDIGGDQRAAAGSRLSQCLRYRPPVENAQAAMREINC